MAKQNKDLEIRFSGPMPVLSALPESAFMRDLTPAGGRWERLEEGYYEVDSRLAAAGPSLRQYRVPTGDINTDQRPEEAAPRASKVSETAFDRWRAEFKYKTSLLEITVDLGMVWSGPEAERPFEGAIGEVRLAHISGDPADLFLVARLMLENVSLRLSAHSKRDAATLIVSGRQFATPRFPPFSASVIDGAAAILQRALINSTQRIIRLQTLILDARAPEGVHKLRVELRRLRAVEQVFRRAAKCPPLQRLAHRARDIARALGPARDWDVFLDQTLPAIAENRYAVNGFARLKASAHAYRAMAWADASAQIADPEFSSFALDLLATAHLQPWRTKELDLPAQNFGASALDRAVSKTCDVARGINPADPASFHALRLALKKLRYGVQLFRGIYPKAVRKPYMRAMAALQDASGVLNDAIVAQKLANTAAAGEGPEAMRAAGFICGYYAARAEAAAKEIDGAWTMFEKNQPFWRN